MIKHCLFEFQLIGVDPRVWKIYGAPSDHSKSSQLDGLQRNIVIDLILYCVSQ